MKRTLWRALMLILAALVLCSGAQAEALDLERTGTIKLDLHQEEGEAPPEGTFWLFFVGEPVIRENNLCFELSGDFEESALSLEDLSKSYLAEALTQYVLSHPQLPRREAAPDAQGQVVFSETKCGLYLIMQAAPGEDAVYERMTAFAATVPMTDETGTRWTYEVTAKPKLVPKIEPEPTPSQPPKEPNLPQTGLPIWPIPVLGGAGLMLFVLGWVLFFSGKKHGKA